MHWREDLPGEPEEEGLGLQMRGELVVRLETEQLSNKVNNVTDGDRSIHCKLKVSTTRMFNGMLSVKLNNN